MRIQGLYLYALLALLLVAGASAQEEASPPEFPAEAVLSATKASSTCRGPSTS